MKTGSTSGQSSYGVEGGGTAGERRGDAAGRGIPPFDGDENGSLMPNAF